MHRGPPASFFGVLGINACVTMSSYFIRTFLKAFGSTFLKEKLIHVRLIQNRDISVMVCKSYRNDETKTRKYGCDKVVRAL